MGSSDGHLPLLLGELHKGVRSQGSEERMRTPQVTPLLAELRSGHVVANLEALTASAADAARDLHKLQHEVRPPAPPCPRSGSCLSST